MKTEEYRFGTCPKCGEPIAIPGLERSKCSAECRWVDHRKKKQSYIGLNTIGLNISKKRGRK